MATVSDVNAQSSFNSVQSTFTAKGEPVVDALKLIADAAARKVVDVDDPTPSIIPYAVSIDQAGPTTVSAVNTAALIPAPTMPETEALYAEATDYLTWLDGQAININTFPDYTTIVTEPPVEPTVDINDITGKIPYEYITPPVLDIPVWDESIAWSQEASDAFTDVEQLAVEFVSSEADYVSPLIGAAGTNALYDAVRAEIESGDYGIDPNDEERLFERIRERESREIASAFEGATALYSSGGFTMPTGAAVAAREKILAESRDRIVSAEREMALKRADLYLEAKKIAQSNGLQIEQQTMSFHNSFYDRALKRVVDSIASTVAVASYNLERGKMFLQKYVAFASAFESQVKASTAVVNMYESQVKAEEAKASFNKALVDEFVSKNKAVVDTYAESVKGYTAVVDNRVKYHAVLADVVKAQSAEIEYRAKAMSGVYDLASRTTGDKMNFLVGKYNADVSATKTLLDKVVAALSSKMEEMKTEAQAATAIASAAMAALNVNLGLSVSGSASVGGQESVSESEDKSADVERRSRSVSETTSHEPDAIDTFYNHNIASNE